jgi:hypothetical protein
LVRFTNDCQIMKKHKCDDFMIVSGTSICSDGLKDINDESLGIRNLKELSYLLGLSNDYE